MTWWILSTQDCFISSSLPIHASTFQSLTKLMGKLISKLSCGLKIKISSRLNRCGALYTGVFYLWHIMKHLSLTPSIKVAIGCRVMITNNIHLAKGVVNGATGIVEGLILRESDPSEIMTVLVRLDGTKELVRVTRTKFARFYRGNDFFLKRTFPMRLAYGITGEFKHFNSWINVYHTVKKHFLQYANAFMPLLLHKVTKAKGRHWQKEPSFGWGRLLLQGRQSMKSQLTP